MQIRTAQESATAARSPRAPIIFGPHRTFFAASVTALAAILLIFVLPLYIPLRPIQTVSASWIAGFNNSVATIAAATLSGLVFLIAFWFNRLTPTPIQPDYRKLTPIFVASVLSASACIFAGFGALVTIARDRYLGDAGYIIEQATVHRDTGRALYTQLEFAYGPLLLLPEIWLSRLLHTSITTAYFITLVVESSLGLLMLAWILNQLPIRTSLRKAALILLAFGAITPHLGLNYTFFRFLSPLAVLLFATRERSLWRSILFLSAGEALELLISPELGLAMAIGVLAFGLSSAWQKGWRWLAAAVVPLALLFSLLFTLGRPYLNMASTFSRGALALPVGPYPHILILLTALLWLTPIGLGRLLRPNDPSSPSLLAFYAASTALLPAALGRCDPLHVLFNGIGILILSLIFVSRSSRPIRRAWVAALLVLAFWNHFVNERLFEARTAYVLRQSLTYHLSHPVREVVAVAFGRNHAYIRHVLMSNPEPEYHLDTDALDRIVGAASIATPLGISPTVEDQLTQTHHYAPGYYAFWVDMMNPAAERRSIDEVNALPWMLLPWDFHEGGQQTPSQLYLFQGYELPYHERNPILYYPGVAFANNLKQHWRLVQAFGPYNLYRRMDDGAITGK